MLFLGLLPVLAISLVFVVLTTFGKEPSLSSHFLDALLIWGTAVVVLTELLSLFRLLFFIPVLITWLLLVILLAVILFRRRTYIIMRFSFSSLDGYWGIFVGIVLFVVVVLVIALVSPPNFVDALTYHMSRVANWMQNRSVAHYPTHNNRQLYMPPFASFAILHHQILASSDRFAGLIQWLSMVGSLVAVYLIAVYLSDKRSAGIISVVYTLTIPTGLLEASSVQTNYAASLWLVIFVYFVIRDLDQGSFRNALRIGASLGLAILTKQTGLFFALPFIVWYGIEKLHIDFKRAVWHAAAIGCVVVVLNAPHLYRNQHWFGSLIGARGAHVNLINQRIGLDVTISNTLRYGAAHLGTTKKVNTYMVNAVTRVHELLGLDVNDLDTTATPPFHIWPLSTNEGATGNPIHSILALIAGVAAGVSFRQHPDKRLFLYFLLVLCGFLIFTSLLKWGASMERLLLPGFVLVSPVVGVVAARYLRPFYVKALCYGLIVVSLPWLLSNDFRPIIPLESFTSNPSIFTAERDALYFTGTTNKLGEQYHEAVDVLIEDTSCRKVGWYIMSGRTAFDYAIWALLWETGEDFVLVAAEPDLSNLSGEELCGTFFIGDEVRDLQPSELREDLVTKKWTHIALSVTEDSWNK